MRRAAIVRQLVRCLDLTSLSGDEDAAAIDALCRRAVTRLGNVAAVCVEPRWIAHARAVLDGQDSWAIAVATVINFPGGDAPWPVVREELAAARSAGADELDVVIPYRELGQAPERVAAFARSARAECAGRVLKFILETGALATRASIAAAARICIDAGADFIKTSTGKSHPGASLEAAAWMLEAIRDSGTRCGFKASGGIRSVTDALAYRDLAARALGRDEVGPERFRIGASGLLEALLEAGPGGE